MQLGSSSSATSFNKSGRGTVNSSIQQFYKGQTYVNEGTYAIDRNGGLGDAATGAAVNLNGGTLLGMATFALDNAGANLRPVNLGNNGGGLAAAAGFTLTVDGVVGGGGALVVGIPASSANNNMAGVVPGTGTGTANATAINAIGTVTMSGANTFTGGTVLQSGTVNINGINALGGANYGGLTFNGGTLQYSNTLTSGSDLSTGSGVTLSSGGGTIDVNGNSVTYANTIGNSGSGALTVKSTAANGVLTLQGANTYTGTTTVSSGKLALGSGASLASANITVGSGATFDVSVPAFTLAGGQALLGGGVVTGNVATASSSQIIPGALGAIGILSFSNNLSLATGETNYFYWSLGSNSKIGVGGQLNLSGSTSEIVVNFATIPTAGTYKLFSYGTKTGTAANLHLTLTGTSIGALTPSLNVTAGEIDLVLSSAHTPTAITWLGTTDNNWDTSTLNWSSGDQKYYDGDFVTFNSSGSGQPNVNLASAFAPGSVTVDTSANDYTFSGPGQIGAHTLTKINAGTLNILTTNSLPGPVVIQGGTLKLGDGSNTGTIGTGNVTNNGTLDLDSPATVATGPITGTGNVTIDAGTLAIGGNSTLGTLTLNAGSLDTAGNNAVLTGLAGASGTVIGNSSTATVSRLNYNGGDGTFDGVIQDTVGGGSKTMGLNVNSTGTLTLTGANNFSGGVTNIQGTLAVNSAAAIGTGNITMLGGAITGTANFDLYTRHLIIPTGSNAVLNMPAQMRMPALYGGGTLGISINGTATPNGSGGTTGDAFGTCANFTGTLNITGMVSNAKVILLWNISSGNLSDGQLQNATVNLYNGVSTASANNSGGNTAQFGALNVDAASSLGGSTVGGTPTYQIGALGGISDIEGAVVGNVVITKVGTGKLLLNNSGNTYSGNTTVSAGSVVVGASGFMGASKVISVASGALLDLSAANPTFSAGQTLTGSGVVTGAVTLVSSDILTPGTAGSAGTLSFSNNFAMTGGGVTNNFDLSLDPTGISAASDKVVVAGNLTITGEHPLVLNPLNTSFAAGVYTLFTYTGNLINENGTVSPGTLNTNLIVSAPSPIHANYTVSNAPGQIVLIVSGAGSNLVWVGDSSNSWQVGTVTNWFDGTSSNSFGQFDTVKFDNTASNFNAVLVGTLMPGGITVNSDSNYVFSGSGKLSGTTSLIKAGTGTLTLTNSGGNDFSGSTVVSNGVLTTKSGNALSQNSSLEIKPAGTVQLGGYSESIGGLSGAGAIDNADSAASVLTVGSLGSGVWSGTITNSGTGGVSLVLNGTNNLTLTGSNYINSANASRINNGFGTLTLTNNGLLKSGGGEIWIGCESAITGKVVVAGGSLVVSNWLVIGRNNTNANGTLVVNSGMVQKAGGNNIVVGSLGATGNLTVNGGQVLNNGMLWVGEAPGANAVVNLNGGLLQATQVRTNYNGGAPNSSVINFNGGILQATAASTDFIEVYAANVQNGGLTLDDGGFVLSVLQPLLASGTGGLIKQGAGTVYLDAANTYTGITIVTNGTLAGSGSLAGSLAVGPAGTLGAGDAAAIGKLTLAGSLNLSGNAAFRIGKNGSVRTNDQVAGITAAHYGGTLTITTNGTTAFAVGDTFTLFSAGSHSGSFTGIAGSPGAGMNFAFAGGVLSVVSAGPSSPDYLTNSVSGNTLSLAWPAGKNWILQWQTNSLNTGYGTNWNDVAGSTGYSATNITVNLAEPTMFFRLIYRP
jgi:autotransporter-associated beta strand protein